LFIAAALALAPLGLLVADSPRGADVARPTEAEISKASSQMATAALNLWNSLTPEQQATLEFKFDDEERFNWHFIPRPRKGLPLKDMTPPQKELALVLLSSGLSSQAFGKALGIMSLDDVLRIKEAGKGKNVRDPENYYFSFFGIPNAGGTWAWRFEGHHCAMNFTIADGKAIAAGPVFLGSNSAKVLEGPRTGMRVLATEEDLGRGMVKSLNDEQKKKAILDATAPKDITTSADRKAILKNAAGIDFNDLNPSQKQLLVMLVTDYADRLRGELAQDDLGKIAAGGWDKLKFAWMGGTEPGEGHYYTVHGPTFLIEYDCTQDNANHIHSVWRDLQNDFGEDILAKHYQQVKH
jgi:hypothetical protein